MEKQYPITGAGEKTPSIPYYFSWINNTNEGSTERQTLLNLDFFRYMLETYGMQIRIYAWDAGNFDGASQGYGDLNGEKFRAQYPEGYKNVVEKAKALGIRFGLWGSPDGFGDTPEQQAERVDFYVHLCRDYHFAAFKLDGVCGRLRPEKAGVYAAMIEECRKYSPDLILLNHRLDFYEAQKYITTFLWNGEETYTDVHAHNRITAPHNRAYTFTRGNVEDENGNLLRLAEDHGVCLSSALDYFEDELVYQAFGRSLIAAPEIYGNPWLLKDDELPRLARIYNFHARYADILVNGFRLPDEYGANAVSRGSETVRLICTGSASWEPKTIRLPLDGRIGLTAGDRVAVILRHPTEKLIGIFAYGDVVPVGLPPFRAVLLEVAPPEKAAPVCTNCAYRVLREDRDGVPQEIEILQCDGGDIGLLCGGETRFFRRGEPADKTERAPVFLGELTQTAENPADGEELYETAAFAICNDALEAECRRRAGSTEIPAVQLARDAFFEQDTYRLRGCEADAMFDGDDETFFDGQSRCYCGYDLRIDGGCLRVDFGEELDADEIVIECFSADEPTREVPAQQIPASAEYACALSDWKTGDRCTVEPCGDMIQKVVRFSVHTLYDVPGKRLRVRYPVGGRLRYLRIAEPMDRIFSVAAVKNGVPVRPRAPRANNLQAHYAKRPTRILKYGDFTIPAFRAGAYLALGVNGDHGDEGVTCTVEIDGVRQGCPRRAPSWKANVWEHMVCREPRNNTFYFPLPEGCEGKTARVYASFSDEKGAACGCRLYLCDRHI